MKSFNLIKPIALSSNLSMTSMGVLVKKITRTTDKIDSILEAIFSQGSEMEPCRLKKSTKASIGFAFDSDFMKLASII